jgi:prepilin-type N-terminal cleavage/methylation domain-containing protein
MKIAARHRMEAGEGSLPARPRRARGGFTLIEIMIVIAIMAIVMTTGIPSLYRAMRKDDLARAINDTIEGCKTARDRAILQGVPYEFVVREDGEINVRKLPAQIPSRVAFSSPSGEPPAAPAAAPYAGFPRKLGEDVMVQMLDVNFINHMEMPEARVRFFPNGTSDEFTIVYAWNGKQRTVMVDIVTGQALEFVRQ